MEVVQRFKKKIEPGWYEPKEDTLTWREFRDKTYSVDYKHARVETLKAVAWQSRNIKSTVDPAMWSDRAARWRKFLAGDMALSGYDRLERLAIQYDFVACFLNPYASAEHNNGLWKLINQSAVETLAESMKAPTNAPKERIEPDSFWAIPEIPYILYRALRRVNLSYYAPTEDTLTWADFQGIMFDLTGINEVHFIYRHAYLLTTVASTVDSGMWSTMASEAAGLLDDWLGQTPIFDLDQVELAQRFCKVLEFDYPDASHNKQLFKAYWEAFSTAREELQRYMPPKPGGSV